MDGPSVAAVRVTLALSGNLLSEAGGRKTTIWAPMMCGWSFSSDCPRTFSSIFLNHSWLPHEWPGPSEHVSALQTFP